MKKKYSTPRRLKKLREAKTRRQLRDALRGFSREELARAGIV